MKKLTSLVVLIFMLCGLLIGCVEIPEIKPDEPRVESPDETPEEKPEEKLPPVGTAVGYLFRDLILTDINGDAVNTADYRGRIIIFNIWATWCPPCKAELPDFNEIASEYAEDIVIIAAHINDSSAADMKAYVSENFPDTKILFAYDNADNSGYFAAGGIGYVPQTAIIGRDGIIIYSDAGALTHSRLVEIIEANK